MAAFFGRTDVVQILLDHGANPNAADEYGRTPLHSAERSVIEYGSGQVVKMLLRRGANPYATDSDGRLPGQWAVLNGHWELKIWLLTCQRMRDEIKKILNDPTLCELYK